MYKWMDKSKDGLRGEKNIVAKAIMVEEFSLWWFRPFLFIELGNLFEDCVLLGKKNLKFGMLVYRWKKDMMALQHSLVC